MPFSSPHVVEDCFDVLRILSNGSILHSCNPVFPVPIRDDGSVIWKDIQFNPTHNLHLRLYKPTPPTDNNKLPILFFFHGGGFCVGSRTWPNFHNCCLRLASDLSAFVLAPDYRLAPEHRLPAAIDDSVSAVEWLCSQSKSAEPDSWLADVADFNRVFISGDSAGANIAHHLAVRFKPAELAHIRIRGYVLLCPFFARAQRTKSEVDCPNDAFLNLDAFEQFWRLSLPAGAGLDHALVNPVGPEGVSLEGVEIGPVLVVVGGCDMLRDRNVEYGERLKEWGKPVEVVEFEGQQHGFFAGDAWSEPADELVRVIRRFIHS